MHKLVFCVVFNTLKKSLLYFFVLIVSIYIYIYIYFFNDLLSVYMTIDQFGKL